MMAKKAKKLKQVLRPVIYRLYPTGKQVSLLFGLLRKHRHLYNALLEHRIAAYKKSISLSYEDQAKEITALRADDPDYKSINAQSLQCTAKRLDRAYKNFFRRCNTGASPGFPRFKSRDRFKSFEYVSQSGWKLASGFPKGKCKMRNGRLRLSGVGNLRLRGAAKFIGTPKTLVIKYEANHWYAVVTCEVTEALKREAGAQRAGLDWGNETFGTIACEDGTYEEIKNPRLGRKAKKRIKKAQKTLSRKKRGSKNREKARKELKKTYQQLKNQRHDFLHKESNKLISRFRCLYAEKLDIETMTSAGKNARERGRNREVLDTAPGTFYRLLRYKAEEAGSEFSLIETKRHKPTQACSGCGTIVPKELSERVHRCSECGLCLGRDENAARVCLNVGLFGKVYDSLTVNASESCSGREPTVCGATGHMASEQKQESPSLAKAMGGVVQAN